MDASIKARNLLESAKWHKAHCGDPECNVSLWVLGELYKDLVQRDLLPEEVKIFL